MQNSDDKNMEPLREQADATIPIPERAQDRLRSSQNVSSEPLCTIPIPESPKNKKSSGTITFSTTKSGTGGLADLFREDEIYTDEINIHADISSAFRHQLGKSGDRYKIEKLLATGGFGQIFLAEDRVLGRKAVVKSLKTQYLNDPDAIEQFITEAKLSAQLEHPAIVPLYSLDTDSTDGLHLAMQLIKGITLREYLKRSLSVLRNSKHHSQMRYNRMLRERLEVFLRLCDAMAYCHSRNVVHNDLKPENIMLASYGQIYVMDWGIATFDGTTSTGRMIGTPAYVAPEKVVSKTSTKQSDVFSLGMILNEMVTLRGGIQESSASAVIERICTGHFEPSTCIDPKYRINKALRSIIEKARNPDPEERYRNVKQLADDIRHYLFYEEIQAHPDSIIQKIFRILFHHKVFAFSIFLGSLLFAAILVFYSFYKESEMIRLVNEKTMWNNILQSRTERVALDMTQLIILLQEQTRNISNTITLEYQNPSVPNGYLCKYYTIEDYAPGSKKRPHGLVRTPYYKNAVTLDNGTFYVLNKSFPVEKLQRWVSCFHVLHSQRLSVMFAELTSDKRSIRKDKNKLFHLKGSLIRRIIISLDEGMLYCYPGMYDPVKSVESFQSEYVRREKRSGEKLIWSPPYLDTSGHSVVACWRILFDAHGKQIGAIGVEINYMELIEPLRAQDKKDINSLYTLVDTEERLIYASSVDDSAAIKSSVLDITSVTGNKAYRFPFVLREIKQPGCPPQFDVNLDGQQCRIFWTRLPVVDWILIRHVPENRISQEFQND